MTTEFRFIDWTNPELSVSQPPTTMPFSRALEMSFEQTKRRHDLAEAVFKDLVQACEKRLGALTAAECQILLLSSHVAVDLTERVAKLPARGTYIHALRHEAADYQRFDKVLWTSETLSERGLGLWTAALLEEKGWTVKLTLPETPYRAPERPRALRARVKARVKDLATPSTARLGLAGIFAKPRIVEYLTTRGIPLVSIDSFMLRFNALEHAGRESPPNNALRAAIADDLGSVFAKHLGAGPALARHLTLTLPKFMIEGREQLTSFAREWTARRFKKGSLLAIDHSAFQTLGISHLAFAARANGAAVCGVQHSAAFGLVHFQPYQECLESRAFTHYLRTGKKPFHLATPDIAMLPTRFEFRMPYAIKPSDGVLRVSYFPNHLPSLELDVAPVSWEALLPETFWTTQHVILDALDEFARRYPGQVKITVKPKNFAKHIMPRALPWDHPALKNPDITIGDTKMPGVELMAQSDVCVFDSLQSGFAESLAMGVPNVTFYPSNLKPYTSLDAYPEFFERKTIARTKEDIVSGLTNAKTGKLSDPDFQSALRRFRVDWLGEGAPAPEEQLEAILATL